MLTIAVIWCLIGALFGIPRARTRYKRELEASRKTNPEGSWGNMAKPFFEASLEQVKWTLLGVFSGISYLAWIFLELAIANRKKLEKPNVLGALGFSILVFVLGVLALEVPRKG